MINVKTGEYYGPFDVLLDLIEKSKMDIYDIQISEITSSYIDGLNQMEIPSSEVTDFILIAASLLYIKTKTLVKDSIETQNEDEEELSKEDLIQRLVEYKKIKKLTLELRKYEENGLKKYTKLQEDLSVYEEVTAEDDIVYDSQILKLTIESLILKNSIDTEFKVEKILNIDEYSLEEYNTKIKEQVLEEKIVNITKMLKSVKKKSEAIIIFLSILELSKRKELSIKQDSQSLEILVELKEDKDEQ